KRASDFVILASGFLRHWLFGRAHSSSTRRIACFCAAIFFPMKTSNVSADSNGSKSQRPATKIKSCAPSAKRTNPFARYTFVGRQSAKRSKQSRATYFSEVNANDLNSGRCLGSG